MVTITCACQKSVFVSVLNCQKASEYDQAGNATSGIGGGGAGGGGGGGGVFNAEKSSRSGYIV